ncbi:MAG: 5'/3'-nucleotidase SurE [Thermoanaerobacteraceae bacterium]|nr:5'/3'-nucleotidase SurE [Thermoanaerobacteraceae bacterium]
MSQMNILLTNDDGVNALGINKLADFLKNYYNTIVVAPERERSAVSHAITLHKPLRLTNIRKESNIEIYYVNGTPSDCIKLAIDVVLDNKPDIVISGINWGLNLGTDILYSGTVSAAIEAAINGIPSMAVSLEEDADLNDKTIYIFIKNLIEETIQKGLPKHTLLNVNIPKKIKNDKGIKITSLGLINYVENFTKRIDPRGKEYYWMAGKLLDNYKDEGSDIVSVKNGYISITPIHFDLTEYTLAEKLKNWNIKIN